MDYEKAYKASLKTAAQWIKDGCTDKEKICLKCVFPELRESEDERIRKEINILYADIDACITELLKARTNKDSEAEGKALFKMEGLMVATLQDLSCIEDYLEKQKVNTEGDFGRGYNCGYEACLNSHGAEWFEKQKDSKVCEEKSKNFTIQKEQKDYRKLYEDIAKSEWFKKAYEGKSLGGDDEQKEQMLKDAVEGMIYQPAEHYWAQIIAQYDGELKHGDKVRIIIVKEDEKWIRKH